MTDARAGTAAVLPGAEPIDLSGGPVGVLLVHGFTGTTQSMRPWATALHEAGHTVLAPRLPGHGTRWEDLNDTTWDDWFGEVERAFEDLRSRCSTVFVMGLSMGATLSLRLAQSRGDQVAGLVLVNGAVASGRRDVKVLPVAARVLPSLKGIGSDIKKAGVTELAYGRTPLRAMRSFSRVWPVVTAELGRVGCPVVLYRSETDHVVDALSGRVLLAGLPHATEVVLHDSYHVATLDNDAERIFDGSLDFIAAHTGDRA